MYEEEKMKSLIKDIIKPLIKPRQELASKADYGHALIIAGNIKKMGAAVIAAKACLRSGCGLLTINIPKSERFILQTTIPESMIMFRNNIENNLHKFSAIGIGPGIGVTKESEQILLNFLKKLKQPMILDADALNIIAANKSLLNKIRPKTILTPHLKEFDRLFGDHNNKKERINTAVAFAKKYNIIIVLKGHKTLITDGSLTFLNTTGNVGLAKGGSGDALTGIITSLLAQGYPALEAAKIGVYIHGFAADIALKNQSVESMLITDVIECLGDAFKAVMKSNYTKSDKN